MSETVQTDKNRDALGRFVKGNKANPTGNNGYMTVKKVIDALNNKAKQKGYANFSAYLAERALINDSVLIAVLKKILPDEIKGEGIAPTNIVQIYRPEPYSKEDMETASRAANRGV